MIYFRLYAITHLQACLSQWLCSRQGWVPDLPVRMKNQNKSSLLIQTIIYDILEIVLWINCYLSNVWEALMYWSSLIVFFLFLKTQFLCQAICTQSTPGETQVIVGSINMG